MANLQALRDELDTGHPDTGAYDGNAQLAADQINAINRTKIVPISSAELLAWSASNGRLQGIKNVADNGLTDEIKSLAQAAYLIVTRDSTSLDLNLPDRVVLLDSLVASGAITTDDKTNLVELATVNISRADELGIGRVAAGTVEQARAL